MDKVQNFNNIEWYELSSEHFTVYFKELHLYVDSWDMVYN
jgi:hypothetical protein